MTRAQATRVETDGAGRVVGPRYVCEDPPGSAPIEHVAHARVVALAAGAIETARLLLHSTSRSHPRGIGNESDQVGRHLQGHYYPGAQGFMPALLENDGLDPGVCIATTALNHGNPGVIGGAMIASEFVKLPIQFWKLSAGQHQAGTCRMGVDAQTSVTEPSGRVHGHDNLFVADGSVHVTNGGFNPALTIMALAFRTAGNVRSAL